MLLSRRWPGRFAWGWATVEDAAALWAAPAKHPLAKALRRPFRDLRLSGTLLRWVAELVAGHPGGILEPLVAGPLAAHSWLRDRW